MYTNWQNITRLRYVQPIRLWFGKTEFYPNYQWLMEAKDLEDGSIKIFAMKDFHWTREPIDD